jgi:AAHS family 4-hydroxybenzoate transporter-like MFS transporter
VDTTIDVTGWINSRKPSSFQIQVLVLCAAAVALEGLDAQNIGYLAPAIISDWHGPPHAFTIVFVSGLVGLLIGCLAIAPLADWIGRRKVMIGTLAAFGTFSLASAAAQSLISLSVLRFLTDMGLGGGMANAIAMTSEYFPSRMRSWMTVIMFCGFPLGASLGGLLAAAIIPSYGWPMVFVVGGVLPLMLAVLLVIHLPESIRYLALREMESWRIEAIMRRIDPGSQLPRRPQFAVEEESVPGLTIKHLMREGRAIGTVLIWIVFFMSLLDLFLLTSWLPVVLNGAGFSITASAIATASLQGSGVVGSVLVGPLLDRRGCLAVLLPLYLVAAVGIVAIGSVGAVFDLILLASCAAGFGVVSGQNCANAFAAKFYPTYIRATGVGWALGIGRIGAIVGPTVGGVMLAAHFSRAEIFGLGAIPALIVALAVVGIMLSERSKTIVSPAPHQLSASH